MRVIITMNCQILRVMISMDFTAGSTFFYCVGTLTLEHGRLGKCGKTKEMTLSRPSHPGTL